MLLSVYMYVQSKREREREYRERERALLVSTYMACYWALYKHDIYIYPPIRLTSPFKNLTKHYSIVTIAAFNHYYNEMYAAHGCARCFCSRRWVCGIDYREIQNDTASNPTFFMEGCDTPCTIEDRTQTKRTHKADNGFI